MRFFALLFFRARDKSRTCTPLPALLPESSVSAISPLGRYLDRISPVRAAKIVFLGLKEQIFVTS